MAKNYNVSFFGAVIRTCVKLLDSMHVGYVDYFPVWF